jgi:hypothetical protein
MSPAQYRDALTRLGLTQVAAARLLGTIFSCIPRFDVRFAELELRLQPRGPSRSARSKRAEDLMRASGKFTVDQMRTINETRMHAVWKLGRLLAKVERQQESAVPTPPAPARTPADPPPRQPWGQRSAAFGRFFLRFAGIGVDLAQTSARLVDPRPFWALRLGVGLGPPAPPVCTAMPQVPLATESSPRTSLGPWRGLGETCPLVIFGFEVRTMKVTLDEKCQPFSVRSRARLPRRSALPRCRVGTRASAGRGGGRR